MVKNRIFLFIIPVLFELISSHALSSEAVDATSGCDKAIHLFWKARFTQDESQSRQQYQEAIELCPGYIRPYELAGNLYRKENKNDQAIAYFRKAAELGTINHKLYYWLAYLLFQKGGIDEADLYIKKSLSIRSDYPNSVKLEKEINKALDKEGPSIILYEPPTARGFYIVYQNENLTVRGIATDRSGVSWIKVNQQDTLFDEHGNFLKDITIHLGKNTIQVEAADSLGNQSQISVEVEGEKYVFPDSTQVAKSLQTKTLYSKSLAIIIGINRYEKWPLLEFATADAEAVKMALENSGFDDIVVIKDQEASQRRILTELFYTLPQRVGRNDRVLFYFAGHGQTEDLPGGRKKGFIIPVDAETDAFASSAISMEQIRSLSSRISAKHILYVMDCCYSGLGLSRSAGVWPGISDYLRKVSSMRVVQIITAGGQGEQVQERGGHGLFTSYFLKAIAGEADLDKDNCVTGTELGAYLRPIVSNASNQAQTPLFGRLEGEGEFLFFVQGAR